MRREVVAMFCVAGIEFAFTFITIPVVGINVGNIMTFGSGIFCLLLGIKATLENRRQQR